MRRRLSAWLAMAGIALNALWPLLANGAAPPQSMPMTICSASGMHTVADGATGAPVQPAGNGTLVHCPYCTGAGDYTPVLAPALRTPLVVAPPAFQQFSETTFYTTAVFQFAARPRGPPAAG